MDHLEILQARQTQERMSTHCCIANYWQGSNREGHFQTFTVADSVWGYTRSTWHLPRVRHLREREKRELRERLPCKPNALPIVIRGRARLLLNRLRLCLWCRPIESSRARRHPASRPRHSIHTPCLGNWRTASLATNTTRTKPSSRKAMPRMLCSSSRAAK